MKKLLALFLATFLLSGVLGVGKAQAVAIFDMNLSNVDGNDWGVYEDIFSIGVSGFGNINQSYGLDGDFNDDDTFTEYAIFQQIGFKKNVLDSTNPFNMLAADGKMMFAYAESLSGFATNFNSGKFDYIFNPGSTINIYIGDKVPLGDTLIPSYLASSTKIATLNLLSGEGAGSDQYLGGGATGSTRLLTSLDYANSLPGIWFTDSLGDLTQLSYPTHFILDTTNRIAGFKEYFDQNGNPAGFNAVASSSGDVYVSPVPEPSTALLLGLGMLGLGMVGRRKYN